MFKKWKMIKDIMKKTSCTKDQAKYLAEELSNLPRIKDIVLHHMGKVNLYNCKNVIVTRKCGHSCEAINISASRMYNILGIKLIQLYLWKFISDNPDYIGFEISQLRIES